MKSEFPVNDLRPLDNQICDRFGVPRGSIVYYPTRSLATNFLASSLHKSIIAKQQRISRFIGVFGDFLDNLLPFALNFKPDFEIWGNTETMDINALMETFYTSRKTTAIVLPLRHPLFHLWDNFEEIIAEIKHYSPGTIIIADVSYSDWHTSNFVSDVLKQCHIVIGANTVFENNFSFFVTSEELHKQLFPSFLDGKAAYFEYNEDGEERIKLRQDVDLLQINPHSVVGTYDAMINRDEETLKISTPISFHLSPSVSTASVQPTDTLFSKQTSRVFHYPLNGGEGIETCMCPDTITWNADKDKVTTIRPNVVALEKSSD